MTESVYVYIRGAVEATSSKIEAARKAFGGLRLSVSPDDDSTRIEPFFSGGGTIGARVLEPTPDKQALELLRSLLEFLARYTDELEVGAISDHLDSAPTKTPALRISEVLQALPGARHTRFRIEPGLRRFEFAGVTAVPWNSKVPSVHSFFVVAPSIEAAKELVLRRLAGEGLRLDSWGDIAPIQAFVESGAEGLQDR